MKKPILIIIIVLAIITIGYGIYYSSTKQTKEINKPSFNTTQTPNNIISDWVTYQNPDYNYSIQYPKNWYIHESSRKSVSFTSYNPSVFGQQDVPLPKNMIEVSITIYPEAKNMIAEPLGTLDEWLQKVSFKERKDVIVAGERAVRTKREDETFGGFSGDVRIIKNNVAYQIHYSPYDSALVNIFDQMLSSFKFTK